MNTAPTIGIVIPTRNRNKLLHEWLCSITKNYGSMPDQIVIVDDASSDGTQIIINNFIKSNINKTVEIISVRNDKCEGVSRSNCIGFKFITTSHVMFAADDDSIRSDAIYNLREVLNYRPDDCIIAGRSMWHNHQKQINWISGRSLRPGYYRPTQTYQEAEDGFLRIPGEATLYNVSLIRKYDLLLPDFQLYGDLYMIWFLTFHHTFTIIDDVLTDFNLNPTGHYSKSTLKQVEYDIILMLTLFEHKVKESTLRKLKDSGLIGYTDINANFIAKNYSEWDTVAFRGHRIMRMFEKFCHSYIPGFILRRIAKYYK